MVNLSINVPSAICMHVLRLLPMREEFGTSFASWMKVTSWQGRYQI